MWSSFLLEARGCRPHRLRKQLDFPPCFCCEPNYTRYSVRITKLEETPPLLPLALTSSLWTSPMWRVSSVLPQCTPPPRKLSTQHQHTTVPITDFILLNAKRTSSGPRKPKLRLQEKLQAISAFSSAPPRLSSARISIRTPVHHVTLDTRALEVICLPIPDSSPVRQRKKILHHVAPPARQLSVYRGYVPDWALLPLFCSPQLRFPKYEREIRKKRSEDPSVLLRSFGQLTNLRFASVRHECCSSRMPVWEADRKADEG